MAPRFRLSTDGQWWGVPGYWINAVSPDGEWRWDGAAWIANPATRPPAVLEALDPNALETNQRGRLTGRQVLRLGRGYLLASLWVGLAPTGCMLDVVVFVVTVILLVILIPIFVVLTILESALGVRMEEGPLRMWTKGRARFVSVDTTAVRRSGPKNDPLQPGARHRIYFTRFSTSLVNYERLGEWAPPIMPTVR